MSRKFIVPLTSIAACLAFGSLFATPAANEIAPPTGFRNWYFVNSLLTTKDSPLFAMIGGLHHIYINSVGLPRLKKGGSTPYPDGTMFADDLREFSLSDGSYVEGALKAETVMVKDAKKFAATGGWGFQAWAAGDPKKPLVTDDGKACFTCHIPQKDADFTFSTFLQKQ
jgi:hypothetical protein